MQAIGALDIDGSPGADRSPRPLFVDPGFGKAPATLAPFAYWEVIATTALGYALLGSRPDSITWIGASIICIGGVINAYMKRPL
jgi:hypothetical protein